MPAPSLRLSRFAMAVLAGVALSACGALDSSTSRLASSLTPHRPPIVQGNFVSREQAEQLKPGMSRQQVREILGTPLVSSLFHADRWDYVFTLRRQGRPEQSHHLTVYFRGDALDRFEADKLPTESEFADQIDTRRRTARVPVLEATEAQLQRFERPGAPAAPVPVQPPASASYPPLESSAVR
ncbi:outer membrane protein assembly factor BamE [Ramlibacter sp. AW1]|uniref:Outer membrane protein assembly factor BamE n=1 Tax=Ramlibacter aurantiacus TaxID=2801330 RepID=A0A936ZPY0_9BURK|nr:outer membrane protein assembly factor BamE [Ramlibacter aurantiacus]MBL0421390.1 outer membrane protein assembly factor BamE [Ramlibacter aurantiacus]